MSNIPQTLPLGLSVKCKEWRMNDADFAEHDAEFGRERKKALARDNHTCRFCGFKSTSWQEVHHFDDDHSNNALSNLITTCSFCHMCQHMGLAGANKEATLIYLPQISQAELHHIVRSALIAEQQLEVIRNDQRAQPQLLRQAREASDAAKAVRQALRTRTAGVEARFQTSDPVELANVMKIIPADAYARRNDFLAGIRLLPLGKRSKGQTDIMRQMVEFWASSAGPYSQLKPVSWGGIMKSVLG